MIELLLKELHVDQLCEFLQSLNTLVSSTYQDMEQNVWNSSVIQIIVPYTYQLDNWNEINFRRKMYSYDDDMEILNYIIKNDCHGKVSGITLWEEMEELGVRKEG